MGGGHVAILCWGCDCYPAPDDFSFNPMGQRLAKEGRKERKKKGGGILSGLSRYLEAKGRILCGPHGSCFPVKKWVGVSVTFDREGGDAYLGFFTLFIASFFFPASFFPPSSFPPGFVVAFGSLDSS